MEQTKKGARSVEGRSNRYILLRNQLKGRQAQNILCAPGNAQNTKLTSQHIDCIVCKKGVAGDDVHWNFIVYAALFPTAIVVAIIIKLLVNFCGVAECFVCR